MTFATYNHAVLFADIIERMTGCYCFVNRASGISGNTFLYAVFRHDPSGRVDRV